MSIAAWTVVAAMAVVVAAWAARPGWRPLLAVTGLLLGLTAAPLALAPGRLSVLGGLLAAARVVGSVWCAGWLWRWQRLARSPLGQLARRYGVPAERARQGWWRVTSRGGRIVEVDDRHGCTVVVLTSSFDVQVVGSDGVTRLQGHRPGTGLRHVFPDHIDREVGDMVESWRASRSPVEVEVEYSAHGDEVLFRAITVRGPDGSVHHARA